MVDIKQFIEVCAQGDVEQASRLLENRKSVYLFKKFFQAEFINTKHEGSTALIGATKEFGLSSTQRLKIVQLLLEKGADVNITSDDGFPTLHYAQAHGDTDVMNLILDHGANVNAI